MWALTQAYNPAWALKIMSSYLFNNWFSPLMELHLILVRGLLTKRVSSILFYLQALHRRQLAIDTFH